MSGLYRTELTFEGLVDGVEAEQSFSAPRVGKIKQVTAVVTSGTATSFNLELRTITSGIDLDSLLLWEGATATPPERMDITDIDKAYHDKGAASKTDDHLLFCAVTPLGGNAAIDVEIMIEV
jgi:hypothetical protein